MLLSPLLLPVVVVLRVLSSIVRPPSDSVTNISPLTSLLYDDEDGDDDDDDDDDDITSTWVLNKRDGGTR